MIREEFLTQFTDLIRNAFVQEGPDFGELLISVYWTMVTAPSVREAKYEELRLVFEKYAAQSRFRYDDGERVRANDMRTVQHFQESEVWKLVRRRKSEWPDEI